MFPEGSVIPVPSSAGVEVLRPILTCVGWAKVCARKILSRMESAMPVKITPDLPEGAWRLVVVTEDVKLGGKL